VVQTLNRYGAETDLGLVLDGAKDGPEIPVEPGLVLLDDGAHHGIVPENA
jgi:hypothetical protein